MSTEQLRERFLRDPLPIQIGSLASNLERVASFADQPLMHQQLVANILQECTRFAEWAGLEAPYETQVVLADTQQAVVQWASDWKRGQPSPDMSAAARQRSTELLKLAGLI